MDEWSRILTRALLYLSTLGIGSLSVFDQFHYRVVAQEIGALPPNCVRTKRNLHAKKETILRLWDASSSSRPN